MASGWAFDMKKPCDTCPFRSDIPLIGAPDWAMDVLQGIRRGNLAHSCHKTDPKADGFKNTKKTQHCMGFLGLMKNMGEVGGTDAILAMVRGDLDLDAIPTEGIWKSLEEMMLAYLCKYRDEGLLSPHLVAELNKRIPNANVASEKSGKIES